MASPFIRNLVERLRFLEGRDHVLQEQLDTQKSEIIGLGREIMKKDELIVELSKRNKQGGKLMDIARTKRFENEVPIAFFTGLTHTIQHDHANQNVVFDKVETNLGNGYHPDTGIITAPVAGTYFFTTSVMTLSGRKICALVVNGVRMAQVYTHGDGHYDHGSQSIAVRLQKGDLVAVQVTENNSNTIYGEGVPYTTFSGFLIQQDYSQPGTIQN